MYSASTLCSCFATQCCIATPLWLCEIMAQTRVSPWGFVKTILIIVFSAFVFKWLLQTTLGWYLRRRTAPRRSSILARVKIEEAQSSIAASQSSESDNGEWEKVERHAIGSAQNGEEADNEWEGIIGFFHPFWSVLASWVDRSPS